MIGKYIKSISKKIKVRWRSKCLKISIKSIKTSILNFEWPWTSNLPSSHIIRPLQIHRRAISYIHLGGYFNLSPFWVPDMVCKVILLCPISAFLLLIGNGSLFFKFTVYIVKIDKKQNPLKSIAENNSSLLQCIWIVCTTPELVCGRGG